MFCENYLYIYRAFGVLMVCFSTFYQPLVLSIMIKNKFVLATLSLLASVGFAGCSNSESINSVKITGENIDAIHNALTEQISDPSSLIIAKHVATELRYDYLYSILIADETGLQEKLDDLEALSFKKTIDFIKKLSPNFTQNSSQHEISTSFYLKLALDEVNEWGEKREDFESLKETYSKTYEKHEENEFSNFSIKEENENLKQENKDLRLNITNLESENCKLINLTKDLNNQVSLLNEKSSLQENVISKLNKAINKISQTADIAKKESEVELTNLFSVLETLELSKKEEEITSNIRITHGKNYYKY